LFKNSSAGLLDSPAAANLASSRIQFSLASTSKQKQREEDGERGDRAAWRRRWRHSARPELAHLDPVLRLLQLLLFGSRRPHLRSAVQLRRERGQDGRSSRQSRQGEEVGHRRHHRDTHRRRHRRHMQSPRD